MTTFVDTSALFVLLDRDDTHHPVASQWFDEAHHRQERLVTHNYVVVESAALSHRRLGISAAAALLERLVPLMAVVYIDEPLHRRAASGYMASLGRRISLVDRASFEVMRELKVDTAFAFDRDFAIQGFRTVP